jgi:transcriptional regulator with XRE-family HTH domain
MLKAKTRRSADQRFSGLLPDRIRHARRLAGISQSGLATQLGVVPSAVAQWELPKGTTPTVAHLASIASIAAVSFEWLATGRGAIRADAVETPALESSMFAGDVLEERLLLAYRRIPARKREVLVRWLEDFV